MHIVAWWCAQLIVMVVAVCIVGISWPASLLVGAAVVEDIVPGVVVVSVSGSGWLLDRD